MSNQNDTLGAQPADQSLGANGEQPDAADLSTVIANLDSDSLSQALGFTDAPVTAPALEPAPPAESDEPDDGAQPDDSAAPIADGADATKPKGRLSVRALPADEQKQLAVALEMVREGKSTTVYAALQALAGPVTDGIPDATPAADVPPVATQATQTLPAVASIESELSDLRAQRKAAKADFDITLESDLTDAIEDKIAELSAAKANAVIQQQAQGAWQQQYISAVDAMEAKYPESADDTTSFYQLLDDKVLAAEARKDPALNDPNYILAFADQVAAVLRIPANARPPAPPARVKAPIGAAVAPGHSQVTRVSPDQLRDLIKNASPEELGAVIFDH